MGWQNLLFGRQLVIFIPGSERHSLHPTCCHVVLATHRETASKVAVPLEAVVVVFVPEELGLHEDWQRQVNRRRVAADGLEDWVKNVPDLDIVGRELIVVHCYFHCESILADVCSVLVHEYVLRHRLSCHRVFVDESCLLDAGIKGGAVELTAFDSVLRLGFALPSIDKSEA